MRLGGGRTKPAGADTRLHVGEPFTYARAADQRVVAMSTLIVIAGVGGADVAVITLGHRSATVATVTTVTALAIRGHTFVISATL